MSISFQLGAKHRIELDQGPISYRETGAGEPVVFVHGLFTNADVWRKVVPRLAARFRCISPDWPHGSHTEPLHPGADLSTPGLARLVADFLGALDLEQVTLIGNDTGGAVCQIMMADHRQRVGRVVLASCDAFEVYPPRLFGFLKVLPRVPGLPGLLGQTQRVRALRRTPLTYGRLVHRMPESAVTDSYTRPSLRREIRRDTSKVLTGLSNTQTLAAAQRFADFDRPVLIAWAADDVLFPAELAERLERALPDPHRVDIPNSRTLVGEDNPEAFADAVATFIMATPRLQWESTLDGTGIQTGDRG